MIPCFGSFDCLFLRNHHVFLCHPDISNVLLEALAIEIGVYISAISTREETGDYSFPADANFPAQPNVWFYNSVMIKCASASIFIVFTQGLLKICQKIQNPFHFHDHAAFPRHVYDINFYNNCRALAYGLDTNHLIGE